MPDVSVTATAGFTADAAASVGVSPLLKTAVAGLRAGASASASQVADVPVTVASGVGLGVSAAITANRVISVSAVAGMSAGAGFGDQDLNLPLAASLASGFSAGVAASLGSVRDPEPIAVAGVGMGATASVGRLDTLSVSASAGMTLGVATVLGGDRLVSATVGVGLGVGSGLGGKVLALSATAGFAAGSLVVAGPAVAVSATAGAGLGASASVRPGAIILSATAGMSAGVSAGATIGFTNARATAGLGASASVFATWAGGVLPGGDRPGGPNRLLMEGISTGQPWTFAETSAGHVILATGVGSMLRWSPDEERLFTAGVAAPATAPVCGGVGSGTLTGVRIAFVRFVDDRGKPGPLSPMSSPFSLGGDGLIDDLYADADGQVVIVCDRPHGVVGVGSVEFRDTPGIGSGLRQVTALDATRLRVPGVLAAAVEWGGGGWIRGSASVAYAAVPTTSDPKIVRRQILRSLEGTTDALYVDVETTDMLATTFQSSLSDDALSAREAVPLNPDRLEDLPLRRSPPPSDKACVCSHLGVLFAAGSAEHSEGHVVTGAGSEWVAVVNGRWGDWTVGRELSIVGAPGRYEVEAWDAANSMARLSRRVSRTLAYARYVLAPPLAERKTVRFSEPDDPEAWPPWSAISIPDDGDEIVGLYSSGSHLHVVERRHLYRVAFSGDVGRSATVTLAARRGAVNARCVVATENGVMLLDETGVWSLGVNGVVESHSGAVGNVFTGTDSAPIAIAWAADRRLWHGSFDRAMGVARWLVAIRRPKRAYDAEGNRDAQTDPTDEGTIEGTDDSSENPQIPGGGESQGGSSVRLDTAICYHERSGAWWFEHYPYDVTASAEAVVDGRSRAIAGVDLRRIALFWGGANDGGLVSPVTGESSSATETTITNASGNFGSLAGEAISVELPSGEIQTRVIASNTATTIEVAEPWSVPPSANRYVVGGIPWSWRSSWLRTSGGEESNPRNVELVHQPVTSTAPSAWITMRRDHLAMPVDAGYSSHDDGVTTTEGSPRISLDLTRGSPRPGYLLKRLEGHADTLAYGDLYLSVSLAGMGGGEVVRIFSLNVEGYREGGGR